MTFVGRSSWLLAYLWMSLLLVVGSMAFTAAPSVTVRTISPSTTAFTTTTATTTASTTTTLHAASSSTSKSNGAAVSRRDCWKAAASAAFVVAATTVTATATVTAAPQSANAALSYDQVQDLLGTPDKTSAAFESSSSGGGGNNGGRPVFLVEPTDDFKANEAKATIFKRQQLQAKQAFAGVQEKITTDPDDETALAQDLDEMRRLVKKGGGLPAGILKDDVIRSVRRRKSRKPKFWPVNCEIAYQDLMDEIRKQQSPNTERDMDHPF